MDSARVFGIGLSVLFGFARWLFPAVPKPFALFGVTVGVGLVIWSLMPFARFGPAFLAIVGMACVAAAAMWQFNRRAVSADAAPAARMTGVQQAAPLAHESPSPGKSFKQVLRDANTGRFLPPKRKDKSRSATSASAEPETPSKPDEAAPASHAEEAEAQRRVATLGQLTNLYILSHDGISPRMAAGMELPPADFLNAELERQGARWRVRAVDGPNAETYEVP